MAEMLNKRSKRQGKAQPGKGKAEKRD